MGNKLYVGNLPYSYRDSDMEQAFSQFGTVTSAKVMMERDTGRSKGFGFVEMGSAAEAQAAIAGMNGQQHGGRAPRGQRSPSDGTPQRWRRRLRWRRRVVAAVLRRRRRWWRLRRRPSRRRRWRRLRWRRRRPRPLLICGAPRAS